VYCFQESNGQKLFTAETPFQTLLGETTVLPRPPSWTRWRNRGKIHERGTEGKRRRGEGRKGSGMREEGRVPRFSSTTRQ